MYYIIFTLFQSRRTNFSTIHKYYNIQSVSLKLIRSFSYAGFRHIGRINTSHIFLVSLCFVSSTLVLDRNNREREYMLGIIPRKLIAELTVCRAELTWHYSGNGQIGNPLSTNGANRSYFLSTNRRFPPRIPRLRHGHFVISIESRERNIRIYIKTRKSYGTSIFFFDKMRIHTFNINIRLLFFYFYVGNE